MFMNPREIDSRLKEYDPELRFIRSRQMWAGTHKYRVERHVQGPVLISPKPPEISWEDWGEIQKYDDRESAKEKYLLIFDCWPDQLDNRIFWTIVMTDTANTTPDRLTADKKDRLERARAKSTAAFGDFINWEGREAWRYANTVRTLPQGWHPKPGEYGYGGMSITGD